MANTRGKKGKSVDLKAICLRFRNKGTADTIDEHKKIITEKGSVWWGWWAKSNEKLPKSLMETYRSKIESGEIPVLLLNPNECKYYVARCCQVAFINTGASSACPENNLMPTYYSNYPDVKVWFKFDSIEEISDPDHDIYSQYSFYDTAEHIVSQYVQESLLQRNCAADCLEVFSMQKASIWFLRNRFSNDAKVDKELVAVWKEAKSRRTNFPKSYYRTKANKILILSDLHFGKKHAFIEGIKLEYATLFDAIKQIYVNDKQSFCGMIISGDFAWAANREEFNEAIKFMAEITKYFSLNPEQIAIVPGNHDISYSNCLDGDYDGRVEISTSSAVSRSEYRRFYKKVYPKLTPEEPAHCLARRILTKNQYPVEIICLDSNILQQEPKKNFVGQGFVGQAQVEKVQVEMELDKHENHGSYRILVLHHHLLPAWYQETIDIDKAYSVLIDSGRVLKFIKDFKIDLVIHGHNHANMVCGIRQLRNQQSASECEHDFNIVSIGSAGVKGVVNSIGELEFGDTGAITYIRRRILGVGMDEAGIENGHIECKYNLRG